MKYSTWHKIQNEELQYHLRKNSEQHLEFKLEYWNSILREIQPYVSIEPETHILEVGCGCCGMLMAIKKGVLVGVDPLMNQYLNNFSYLADAGPKWINCAAEQLDLPESFDIIFCINSLDHVLDPEKVAKKLDRHLMPGGHIVIALNCHNTDFFYSYYNAYHRRIDPHHPHHFRLADVGELFPSYRVRKMADIDHLFISREREYQSKVLRRSGINWKKAIAYLMNPFRYPIAFSRVIGNRPVCRKKHNQKSIFSTYLFVFEKPACTEESL